MKLNKKNLIWSLSYIILLGEIFSVSSNELVNYVDPFIGTKGGRTYPGASVPFGMTSWTPYTKPKVVCGTQPYDYNDLKIYSFRGSHFPSGSAMHDYGCVNIMPVKGIPGVNPEQRASYFKHENESASPGYYSVYLDNYNIRAEITATLHSGFLRFEYPETNDAYLFFDVDPEEGWVPDTPPSYVKIIPDKNEVVGYNTNNFVGYFYAKINKKIGSYGIWYDDKIINGKKKIELRKKCGVFIKFSTNQNEIVLVKIGTSFISIDQAKKNLEDEIKDWDFENIRNTTKELWNEHLKKIEVEGGTEEQKTIFYTALYHCMLVPRIFTENGKYFSAFDYQVHKTNGFVYYNDFSLWDTFRALHPLMTIIEPDRQKDMIKSLISMYEEGGWIPKWPNPFYTNCMIGSHGDTVIIDSYLKGIKDFDTEKAYEGIRKNAFQEGTLESNFQGRLGIDDYIKLGYVPVDGKIQGGTSMTLEYAYQDYCIAQFAKTLNKNDDYEYFIKRAVNYKNVFDQTTGYMRGRKTDGSWYEPFVLIGEQGSEGFIESNRWQYNFFVPHDIKGLIKLNGGTEKFIEKLNMLFELKQYIHSNEPCHNFIFLYNYVGMPWITQEKVRWVLDVYYSTGPAGLCGDDDCGQMSAWYVFNAIGFYPVCPGQPIYHFGSPIFRKITVNLNNGKKFVIEPENVSKENKYIQTVELNGKQYEKTWFYHSEIINGSKFKLKMGPIPNKKWGSSPEFYPPSLSD